MMVWLLALSLVLQTLVLIALAAGLWGIARVQRHHLRRLRDALCFYEMVLLSQGGAIRADSARVRPAVSPARGCWLELRFDTLVLFYPLFPDQAEALMTTMRRYCSERTAA